VTWLLTWYCACLLCCGKTDGITAAGTRAKANWTIACPRSLPLGTLLEIDGEWRMCLDRGGAIRGKRLDVFVNSHKEALKLGTRRAVVEVVR